MAHEIRIQQDAWAGISCTCASLGASGGARLAALITNTLLRPALLFFLQLKPNVAPTAGTLFELFLIRGNGSGQRTDRAGSSNASFTGSIVNAQLIGTLQVTNTTDAQADEFDTAPMGKLGTEFSFVIRNSTNQALTATETDHVKQYSLYLPAVQ